jgi:hypothetical protein
VPSDPKEINYKKEPPLASSGGSVLIVDKKEPQLRLFFINNQNRTAA